MRLPRALSLIPEGPNYRHTEFEAGLAAAGYEVVKSLPQPEPSDIIVVWNRSNWRDAEAKRFEAAGARVVVAENGYFGKVWKDRKWFALALGQHAGAGRWNVGGPERWDSWGAELAPWRDGREIVILEQRGIGPPGIQSPPMWAQQVQAEIGGRIRPHPGAHPPAVTLADDLKDAKCAVTWHSGAALHALLLGVPVFYAFPKWIGASAARPLSEFDNGPVHGDRLEMFHRLAWAMWHAEEVKSGEAFEYLLRPAV